MAFRVSERFGHCPIGWFMKLPAEQQNALLIYERVREQEEMEDKTTSLQAMFGKKGI